MNILLIGSGAREHAIARAIKKSSISTNLFCFGSSRNPGIRQLTNGYFIGKLSWTKDIVLFAKKNNVDFAIIGPETPLAAGIVDLLGEENIPCVGPKQKHARLETSKSFTRDLMRDYEIPGKPRYTYFETIEGVRTYLLELGDDYVIKADGLMGGKGVKVAGDHLQNHEEALLYCRELINKGGSFVIEEKFIGQEFSYMSFCDGTHLAHMIPVQDHKRAYEGDTGPNTGGMGSYSDSNHLLPFLTEEDILQAQYINQKIADALRDKFGEGYKGILYGGFMSTKDGVKVIEYNARFGDPEAMNLLALLESDFVELCQALLQGELRQEHVRFAHKASVCKYAVPEGYPENPIKNQKIDVAGVQNKNQLYYASVDARGNDLYETGSRTVAVVGIANTIEEAERIAEQEIEKIRGPLFHRKDIGTNELIQKKIEMMNELRGEHKQQKIKLAILGSTRGTDMQTIIEAIHKNELDASIEIVISNKADAYILERAKNHNINSAFIDSKNKTREEFDTDIVRVLDQNNIDLILLIGYMRILSPPFVQRYKNRIMNVHPSLLPKFRGGMDTDVHQAVLDAKETETGCTIHFVDEGVDTGKIIIQKKCTLEPYDTAEFLKTKVQKLEGEAFIQAIKLFQNNKL